MQASEPRKQKTISLICAFLCGLCYVNFEVRAADWPSAGQNIKNTRANDKETIISPANVSQLAVKWVYTTAGDVSATPAVDDRFVYFPDFGGRLHCLDRQSGQAVWSRSISEYTGVPNSFSRVTPTLAGTALIIGTQMDSSRSGARVLAIAKSTGNLIWSTKVDDHLASIITQSPVVHSGQVFVGVSSGEEGLATDPAYPCCSFRGSMVALNLKDGSIAWKTFMTPANKGFSGNAVWGSTPAIDPKNRVVYITTGNNYTVPQAVLDCMDRGGTAEEIRDCVASVDGSEENYFDSVVALDMRTGAIKWVNTVIPFDAWTVGCIFEPNVNCPDPEGPDFDFGQGPALFNVKGRTLLGAGQKSGTYWTFDPASGNVVWSTEVGPGGTLGGLEWGSAVADGRIYTAIANNTYAPFTFTVGPQAGRTVKGGFWSALDAATGRVLWQVAGNKPPAVIRPTTPGDAIAINTGPVSTANGVVFAGALDAVGTMYALDGATGNILWTFESGGSVNSSPAIVDGVVFWGSGYQRIQGTPNNKFYAFSLP
jgi:polyvinyl alcohol dehydrogenase (cytochrome)